jgi:hypothetical protein
MVAARASSPLAAIAVGADLIGVALAAVFSSLLVARLVTFEGSLLAVTRCRRWLSPCSAASTR